MAQKSNKPKMTLETVELDPKTKARMQTQKDTAEDQRMLEALGIKIPREEVLVMRGVNDPTVYAFFDLRDQSLIRWATNKEVFKAVDQAKAGDQK